MLKFFFSTLRFIRTIILLFIVLLILIVVIQYITCPVYRFQTRNPFSGTEFYNPYQNIDSALWRKANFQVQSYAWAGITAGRGNTNKEIYTVYNNLGYDIIATSDYQRINRYRNDDPSYIPVYEHGYGIKKNHQVLVGSKRVLWRDYPLFQSIHNKQHILNLLRKDNELVYIAHPKLRNGYQPGDMKYLANYDGIEVLNNFCISLEHWDAALSSGNYITILGNDDAHDVSNPDEIGHHCTFINSPSNNKQDILKALKAGMAFGARIFRHPGETFKEKIKRTKILPVISLVEMRRDTLYIRFDSIANEIRFIGQNGKLLKKSGRTNEALYKIREEDTYIRTEIEFPDQSVYYLNPVCRYNGISLQKAPVPKINVYRTNVLRIIGFATLIFIILNYFLLRKRVKQRNIKHSSRYFGIETHKGMIEM